MESLFAVLAARGSLVALGLVALVGSAGCNVEVGGGAGTCEWGGETYDEGETFSPDGCNGCACNEGGEVVCTLMLCGATCEYNEETYFEGDTFEAGDGCNSCSCGADGQVACTLLACETGCEVDGQVHEVGQGFYVECNVCMCEAPGVYACSQLSCLEETCSHEGYLHAHGETWQSFDQCESCTCTYNGQVACTASESCSTCHYAGALHQSGDTFASLDGCNTCSCVEGGVACTEIACACDPEVEWWRTYVGDAESCQVIDFGCAEPTAPFFNECGCGCEQPAWCPESFDCMPPSNCDVPELEVLCPNSTIAL